MKFDVVVGNPPYNNDIYLDFVQMGYQLSNKYTCMITPAKWQAKGGAKNEAFRENIVPNMSKIVYYPDCKDIFDIMLSGGVCYYLVDSSTYDKKHVEVHNGENISTTDNWESSFIKLDLSERESKLLKKITSYPLLVNGKLFKPDVTYFWSKNLCELNSNDLGNSGIYSVDTRGNRLEIKKDKLKNISDVYKYKLGCSSRTFEHPNYTSYIIKPNEVMGRDCCVLNVGTIEECKYTDTFYRTKLVWWLIKKFFGDFHLSNDANIFRFVPDPGSFNRIFEDKPLPGYTPNEQGEYTDKDGNVHCSLYVKYKLTPEEINIIESVIKERK